MDMQVPHESLLFASAVNPVLDLVALVSREAPPEKPASTLPPGVNAAQAAMRQRVLDMQARKKGHLAHPASSSISVQSGPTVRISVWRTGKYPSPVWDKPFDLPPAPPGTTSQSLQVLSMTWDPKGDRLAVRACITSLLGGTPHHILLLYLLSVYDGGLLHARLVPCSNPPSHASLLWIPLRLSGSLESQALHILQKLAPLYPAQPFDDDKARWHGSSVPHSPPGESPSAACVRGLGVLASIPFVLRLDEDAASLLLSAENEAIEAWMDGTVPLAPTVLPGAILSLAAADHSASALIHDASSLRAFRISLPWDVSFLHIARLSSSFQHCLAIALDATFYATHAWSTFVRPRANEWLALWHDLANAYGVDIVADWMTLLTTALPSQPCEQLLSQLTEGTLIAMESDMKRGLKRIRRLAATNVVPACERLLILLTEWMGCASWSTRYPPSSPRVSSLISLIQTCHGLAISLQEHAERELLAFDEFYKWWRYEQERLERSKSENPSAHVPIQHDTLSVLELCRRGFLSPELDAILSAPTQDAAPAPPGQATDNAADSSDDSHAISEPLFPPQRVLYEETLPSNEPVTVHDALAWLDAQEASESSQSQPADDQWHQVFHLPSLFTGPAASAEPRMLPGHVQSLFQQLEDAGKNAGHIFSAALLHTSTSSSECADPWPMPAFPCLNDDALRSVASDAAAHVASRIPRPMMRAIPSQRDTHTHLYFSDTHISIAQVSSSSCAVETIQLPAGGQLLDATLSPLYLFVLWVDTEQSTHVGAFPASRTPSWPPPHSVPMRQGRFLAASQRDACLVLKEDKRSLSVYVPCL